MIAVDYAAMPPEVNSGRMYAGAGSAPMLAAAASWDRLAAELSSTAGLYESKLAELTGETWQGSSSEAMAASVNPYIAWMQSTAMQAEQTANQARTAAAAYEAAFSATVPPPLVAANRATLAALMASNILGQNTAAIAATETHYAEMWAQDAMAMLGYASASSTASQLTPFASPTPTANSGGVAKQAAAVNAAESQATQGGLLNVKSWLLDAATLSGNLGAYQSSVNSSTLIGAGVLFIGIGPFATGIGKAMTAASAAASAAASVDEVTPIGAAVAPSTLVGASSRAAGAAGLSAHLGRSVPIGGLSTPQSWAINAPEVRLASAAMPLTGAPGLKLGGPGGWLGGLPPIGSVVNAKKSSVSGVRIPSRLDFIAQEGLTSAPEEKAVRWTGVPTKRAPDERDELNELRVVAAKLAKERDLLKHSAALLIKERGAH